jgi:adenylate kinase family enzyme
MSAPELIVLNGVLCSGKSTISRALVAMESEHTVRHLPMGERLRGIASGDIPSAYAPNVEEDIDSLKQHTQIHDPNLPIAVFEEFIDEEPSDLVILDGFPRYPDRLAGFRESIKSMGANLLAACEVHVPVHVVRERNSLREQRYVDIEENESFIQKRLVEYQAGPALVMEALAAEYPYYQMDGTQLIEDNVATLNGIYTAHSQRA